MVDLFVRLIILQIKTFAEVPSILQTDVHNELQKQGYGDDGNLLKKA
ncbi:hypothetical protein DEAC_c23680 [Desulfosporosinus acididurans]|uniref:Uncharacterized protein n=1 Tax=Desulfosporosinus acididurans TaxID=476652 RepID=A0A0J1FRW3_9FIRM|nr:hypothetical protein [Desulfosporosinus acididurans]KLU65738.1 hypothetical protein DEAC_c23680 [Desulfosporosinus acididurans]